MSANKKRKFSKGKSSATLDKQIVVVTHTITSATQTVTNLQTFTTPCTVLGIRWNLTFISDFTTAQAEQDLAWAIVLNPETQTASILAVSDGATLYAPEQNCLVWGVTAIPSSETSRNPQIFSGDTRTLRKMRAGDQLQFISKLSSTGPVKIRGAIQYFCRI